MKSLTSAAINTRAAKVSPNEGIKGNMEGLAKHKTATMKNAQLKSLHAMHAIKSDIWAESAEARLCKKVVSKVTEQTEQQLSYFLGAVSKTDGSLEQWSNYCWALHK